MKTYGLIRDDPEYQIDEQFVVRMSYTGPNIEYWLNGVSRNTSKNIFFPEGGAFKCYINGKPEVTGNIEVEGIPMHLRTRCAECGLIKL
jgi:hypothetical protein